MKILQMTSAALGILFVVGTAHEGRAELIQAMGSATQEDQIILAREGHRHHRHHRHWHAGGYYYGPGVYYYAPRYYYAPTFQRVCGWNSFGQHYCHRQYHYY